MAESEQDMRDLDSTTASMDIHSLNNVVVSLRGLMKKVQLFTIQKLVRQSKQLRQRKKGLEDVGEKKRKKAERLISEVGTIKGLKIDHTIKYALANTRSFEEIAATGDLETRAMVRLATHPLMVQKVDKWREEHNDWQALAAFIMYKNTGRRFKKKKKKGKTKPSTDTPKGSEHTVEVKIGDGHSQGEAKNVLQIGDGLSAKELARKAKSAQKELFIQRKVKQSGGVEEGAEGPQEVEEESSQDENEAENEPSDESEEGSYGSNQGDDQQSPCVKNSLKDGDTSDEDGDTSDEDGDTSDEDGNISSKDESNANRRYMLKSKAIAQIRSSENELSASEDKSNTCQTGQTNATNHNKKKPIKTSKLSADCLQDKKQTPEKKDAGSAPSVITTTAKKSVMEKIAIKKITKEDRPKSVGDKAGKEMAITKIDLTALSDDVEDFLLEKTTRSNTSFHLSSASGDADEKSKPKRKKKDDFFAVDGDENDDDGDNATPVDAANERHYDSDGDNDMQRRRHHKKIESAFVGRLCDKQAKGDWGDGKGSYTNRPDRSMEGGGRATGGRGRGSFPRGRGTGRGGFSSDRNRSGYHPSSLGSGDQGGQDDGASKRKVITADEGKLHPSWEAKRLKKERESKIADFQGTRIKFDD